jgi:hypothetical protein
MYAMNDSMNTRIPPAPVKRLLAACFFLLGSLLASAQYGEKAPAYNIQTALLFPSGNQMGLPVIQLNGSEQLELHFDDFDGNLKNYYYTFVLCNADWSPALLSTFDYIKGFANNRINTYRNSSIAQKKYMHYMAYLPERNAMPTRSGNYLLKVCLDGDTSKTVFSKRFMVVEEKVTTGAQAVQPVNVAFYRSHQRMTIKVNAQAINITNPQQQLKVVVMQNNRWDNAITNILPTFIRGKEIEYNTDNGLIFEAGREWRWLDLRSVRYWSDRVQSAEVKDGLNQVYVKPDAPRTGMRYNFYNDFNGMFVIENTDRYNPYWQGDYARVHFSYFPPGNVAYTGKDVYITGALTRYAKTDSTKLVFNTERGAYETSLLLKQGFYSYEYATAQQGDASKKLSITDTEGSFWETENTYQVLVYYRPFGARADELIGYTSISSFTGQVRPGF